MTAGQIKAAAFVDELTKVAIPSLGKHETNAALTGLLGAAGLYKYGPWGEGGRSREETKAHQAVQNLENLDQTDPQVQEELKKALLDQRRAAHSAEGAGGWLGAAGLEGGALYARHKLLRVPGNLAERGASTTPEELAALHSDLTKRLGYSIPTLALPGAQSGEALSVPKGGFLPKFLRNLEARKYVPRFGNKENAAQALESGFVIAPMNAGPHFSAHEFGHAAFGGSALGKLTHLARVPGALAGNIAGLTAATTSDPDSTASKLSPLMAAAGVAPILGEEAAASINAIKSMKRTGFSPQQLSMAKKQLGRAFGTYALGLGLPAVSAPYIIRKVKQYNQARRERQGLESPGQLQQRIQSLPQTGD